MFIFMIKVYKSKIYKKKMTYHYMFQAWVDNNVIFKFEYIFYTGLNKVYTASRKLLLMISF